MWPSGRAVDDRRPAGAPLDVLVIGGGQAGLAMGYYLAQRGLRFQIVDLRRDRRDVAVTVGFPAAVHPSPVRQSAGPALPLFARRLPG
jgi:putative flavoprotein involved in K+ transport